MKKVYATDRERKSDQLLGIIAFPLVNVVLWLITGPMLNWPMVADRLPLDGSIRDCIRLLPWIVNGLILILAFLFRPEIGVGYIASIALIVAIVTTLGILLVGACLVSLPFWSLDRGDMVCTILYIVGFIFLLAKAAVAFRNWWSPPSTSHNDQPS